MSIVTWPLSGIRLRATRETRSRRALGAEGYPKAP
jgi:hypothetical protein